MSQRKAKEYRRCLEQYGAVVDDVDDLKRRIGAMEARHRREDQLAEIQRRQARRDAEARQADDLNRKQRHRREQRQRARRRQVIIAIIAIVAAAICMIAAGRAVDRNSAAEPTAIPSPAAAQSPVVVLATADPRDSDGEDPQTVEKTEEALLASGYYSVAVPMCYEYQDYMRTYCAAYGCPYPLALAVAEVESNFNMNAVGSIGEVGMMQLNPGRDGTYHAELEAATGLDPTTPAGNIAAGCYKLGQYMAEFQDAGKAAMAYNMGRSGALSAWAAGITSTDYSTAVLEAMEKWECTVNAWDGV